jgi:hypothetical protein
MQAQMKVHPVGGINKPREMNTYGGMNREVQTSVGRHEGSVGGMNEHGGLQTSAGGGTNKHMGVQAGARRVQRV